MEQRTAELSKNAFAVAFCFLGTLLGVSALVIGLSSLFSGMWDEFELGIAFLVVCLGVVYVLIGFGLWRRRSAARIAAIVMAILGILVICWAWLAAATTVKMGPGGVTPELPPGYIADQMLSLFPLVAPFLAIGALAIYLFGFNRDVKALFSPSSVESAKPAAKA